MRITCGGARTSEGWRRRWGRPKDVGRKVEVEHGTKKTAGKPMRIRAAQGARERAQHGQERNAKREKKRERVGVRGERKGKD